MSKKKRIKKLVKGHLNSKNAAGADIYTTAQDKIDRLAVLDDITQTSAVQLLEALTGTTGGDADGVAFAADAFPFDARESRDTDNDGIGDNRDIIRTKVELDAIFKTLEKNVGEAANGTLQDLLDRLAAAIIDLNACAGIADAGARTTRYNLLLAAAPAAADGGQPLQTSQPSDLTVAGLDALKVLIDADAAKAEALKVEIAAMTATNGVTIDEPAPYNTLNAAEECRDDAGNTDVAAAVVDVVADTNTAKGHVGTITA